MKQWLWWSLALALPASHAADSLLGPKAAQEFLPVDEAFELQPLERRGERVRVEWHIAKGYYLYKERLSFRFESPAGAIAEPQLPSGEPHEDEIFGKTTIYRESLVAMLRPAAPAAPLRVVVGYQGCADAGLCYPPQTRTLELKN